MLATCHGRAEVKGLPPLDVVIQKRHATIHVCSFNIKEFLIECFCLKQILAIIDDFFEGNKIESYSAY